MKKAKKNNTNTEYNEKAFFILARKPIHTQNIYFVCQRQRKNAKKVSKKVAICCVQDGVKIVREKTTKYISSEIL